MYSCIFDGTKLNIKRIKKTEAEVKAKTKENVQNPSEPRIQVHPEDKSPGEKLALYSWSLNNLRRRTLPARKETPTELKNERQKSGWEKSRAYSSANDAESESATLKRPSPGVNVRATAHKPK